MAIRLDPWRTIVAVHFDSEERKYALDTLVWQAITNHHPGDPPGTPTHTELVPGVSGSASVAATGISRIDVNVPAVDIGMALLWANYGLGEGATVTRIAINAMRYEMTGAPQGITADDLPPGVPLSAFFGRGLVSLGGFADAGSALVQFYFKDDAFPYSTSAVGGAGGRAIVVNGTLVEGEIPT